MFPFHENKTKSKTQIFPKNNILTSIEICAGTMLITSIVAYYVVNRPIPNFIQWLTMIRLKDNGKQNITSDQLIHTSSSNPWGVTSIETCTPSRNIRFSTVP